MLITGRHVRSTSREIKEFVRVVTEVGPVCYFGYSSRGAPLFLYIASKL